MNPGLRFLLRRRARGHLRYLARRMRTVRGAVGTVAIGGFLVLFIGAQLAARWMGEPGLDRERVLALGPLLLLALFVPQLLTARGLHFSPAEVDFLFPAPLTRRERLGYHLASRVPAQMLAGLWLALYSSRSAPLLAAAGAGLVLAVTFTYLVAQWTALLRVWAGARLRPAAGRALGALAVGAPAAALLLAWRGTAPAGDVLARVDRLAEAPVVRVLTLPLRPFVELYAAPSAAAALPWLALSAGLCAAMAAAVLFTDVPYEERALAVSGRINDRLARMRGGGAPADGAAREGAARRVPLPELGFLGGAAPLARRHLRELARNPRSLLPLVLLVAMVGVGGVLASRGGEAGGAGAGMLGGGIAVALFMGLGMRLDFRGDLDRMAFLKGLPLSAFAVAVGQLFAGTVVVSLLMALAGAAFVVASGVVPSPWALAALPALPVLVWCLLAVDNALFLLLPYRPPVPGDPSTQYSGRALLGMLLKALALGALFAVAALTAWGVYRAAGRSVPAGAAAAGVVMLGAAVLLTMAVAAAFSAFDPSRDVPA